jgi:S-formylglutathione hydrolase FrmB
MALCNLHYFSTALKKMTAATLNLPEGEDGRGPFPVFYLLHGRLDDHTAWVRQTSIERYAQRLAFIIVMPDAGRGFYTKAQEGFAYETAMLELIAYIDQTFHTDARREARVIGGLSMGGYGALKLALKHPDLFCGANSHSGALFAAHSPLDPANPATAEVMGTSTRSAPAATAGTTGTGTCRRRWHFMRVSWASPACRDQRCLLAPFTSG